MMLILWRKYEAMTITPGQVTGVARLWRVTLVVLAWLLAGCMAGRGGVLDLSWTPPTANADGSSVTDIASYRVYYGTATPPCPGGTFLTVASPPASPGRTVSTRLSKLKMGELYYVAVTAVSSSGVESGCSIATTGRAHSPD
jgi:hypothetical protein